MVPRQRAPQPQPRQDAGGAAPAAGGPPRPAPPEPGRLSRVSAS